MEPARGIQSSHQSHQYQNQSDEFLREVVKVTECPPNVLLEGDTPKKITETTPLTMREVESTGGLSPYFKGGSCPDETNREARSPLNSVVSMGESVVSMGESSGNDPSNSDQPVDEITVGTQSQHSIQFWTNRIQQLPHEIETASPAASAIIIARYQHLLQLGSGRYQSLMSQYNTLTSSLNECTDDINNLEDALHEKIQKLSTMTTETDQLKQEILILKDQLFQEKESSKQASLHSKTLLEDNQRLEAKLEKEAGENVHLKQELEQSRTEVSDLKAELSKQQALILTLQEQLNSQPAQKPSSEPLPVEPVFAQVDVPPVIAYEPVASTSETVLLPGAPQNLEELFKRSEQLGIPQAYVALGYPIRKQQNGEPVIIRSKKDLGDTSKFDSAKEDEILNQIARDFCNGDRDLVNNYWYQASFLEYFYYHAPVISWHSLPHASFCRKIEGVRSIGVDKAHLGEEAKSLYSDEETGQLMDWRNEQNEDEALKAFTPECWQPREWLSTLAKAHRDNSGNKLMLLAGLWADFSLVMVNNACRKSAKDRVRQNKVLFDWRKLSDTPDPMAMHSGGQGETMQSKAKRKIPRGKTVSSKKRR